MDHTLVPLAHDAVVLVTPLVCPGEVPDSLGAEVVVVDIMVLLTTQITERVCIGLLLLHSLDLPAVDNCRVVHSPGLTNLACLLSSAAPVATVWDRSAGTWSAGAGSAAMHTGTKTGATAW